MTNILLQPGEAVRIENRDGLLLTVSASSRDEPRWEIHIVPRRARRSYAARVARTVLAWWLRMHRGGACVGRRFIRARREHAQALELAQLDARILKDIGLEPHRGGSLARRVHAYREQELLRLEAARRGLSVRT